MRSTSTKKGQELLADIHKWECIHHSSSHTIFGKVPHGGFYRPTALRDASELVKSCEACQFHGKKINQPAQGLQTILLSWSFAVWGLDILGPFPRAVGGYQYLYFAIDKFARWVEVEPVCTIPTGSAVNFIKGIVCRFGIPNRIITDNGSQFTSGFFKAYCTSLGTQIFYASVAHPRSNGQAERTNAEVLKGLKTWSFYKKLTACGKNWLDELQTILWSIRSMTTKHIGKIPFFMVYGAKTPADLKHRSTRVLASLQNKRYQLTGHLCHGKAFFVNNDTLTNDCLRQSTHHWCAVKKLK